MTEEFAYVVRAPDGKRLEWHVDDVLAFQRADTFNHYAYGRGGGYTVDRVSRELIVNDYPQDEIPEPGGYNLIADMDDGETLCEWCVRDPFNPVHDERTSHMAGSFTHDGWGVVDWSTTGGTDSYTVCVHCSRVLVEDTEMEDPNG